MAENDKNTEGEQPKEEKHVPTYVDTNNEDYGYYFYPSRNAKDKDGIGQKIKSMGNDILYGSNLHLRNRCYLRVQECFASNPRVQLLFRALRTHGCTVDIEKHIRCEPCRLKVSGGFDFFANQVVVCDNNVKSQVAVCNVLAHEMLHAFDKCRAKFDINNLEHLACTEIRAANLFHCSLASAIINGEAYPWDYKKRHMNCVRRKAKLSMLLVRNVSEEDAGSIVDRVFEKCYKDLEPFGRRLKIWGHDDKRALNEGILYGYSEY